MDDDLDTPGALAGIFELVTAAHTAATPATRPRAAPRPHGRRARRGARPVAAGSGTEVDEESARLVAERDEARRAKDFARADALRDELVARGWTVEDTPTGTAVRR